MENSIYLALSKQMVLQTNMDIVANNVANMNTAGYRGLNPVFEEFIADPRYGDDPLSFVYDKGQYENTDAGSLTQTGNPLDVALVGDGFMAVQTRDGGTGYTRDGGFRRNDVGMLVNAEGRAILGQGGPITLPDDATEIKIDQKGVISSQNGQIGQLQIVEFENVQELRAVGGNTYVTEAAPLPAANTVVEQGFIEGSNVQPVLEMTRMIQILREFQGTQKILETEHDRMRSAIQKLSEV